MSEKVCFRFVIRLPLCKFLRGGGHSRWTGTEIPDPSLLKTCCCKFPSKNEANNREPTITVAHLFSHLMYLIIVAVTGTRLSLVREHNSGTILKCVNIFEEKI